MRKILFFIVCFMLQAGFCMAIVIDFSVEMKDFEGQFINTPDGTPITIKRAAINALIAVYNDEPNLTGEDKIKRYSLAMRINNSSHTIELQSEEIAIIKKLIAKMYGPLIVGQAWEILEGKQAP